MKLCVSETAARYPTLETLKMSFYTLADVRKMQFLTLNINDD